MKRTSLHLVILLAGLVFNAKALAATSFTDALKLYKDKQYQQAYEAFMALADSDYTNVDYNYYLARSAFFIKHYNEAISAYERILIMYPHNARSKLELGRIYFEMHRYTEARRYLNEVLKSDAPQAVKNNIRFYLARMEEAGKKPKHNTVKATLLGSLFYDSNLNYSPVDDVMTLTSGKLTSSPDVGAWGSEQMLLVNHRYDNPEKYDFAWKNDFVLYNKISPGNSDYNILYGSYTPALSFQKDQWSWDAGLTFDTMNSGKDHYLMSYGLAPSAVYMPNLTEYISTQFKLLKRDYQKASGKPDTKFGQLSVTYQKRMGPVFSWFGQGTLETELKDKTPSSIVNIDYRLLGAKIGAGYLLPKNISLSGSLGYQSKQFLDDDRMLNFLGAATKKQQDSRYYAELVLAKQFAKNFTAQFRVSRVQNDSNISRYAYQKNLYTLNILKRF